MSLSSLPNEVLHKIGRKITSLSTLWALASVNRRFYAIFDQLLYQADGRYHHGTAIAWAAERGMMEIIQKALGYGIHISTTSSAGEVLTREPEILCRESASGHFSNGPPPKPLCLAVRNVHLDITEFFLEKGCSVEMSDSDGLSLLCLAVMHDHPHLVRTLLSRGARQVRWKIIRLETSKRFKSPIQFAASKGTKEIVLLLLFHYGPDSTRPSTSQLQEAIGSALRGGHKHILSPLLDAGTSLDFHFRVVAAAGLYPPLHWAVDQGDAELLNLFMAGGNVDPNLASGMGNIHPR